MPPDFYEREFGIVNTRDPIPDYWTSLRRITPDDLRGFYDRYYAPGAITVTIVGDLDPDSALALAERTFGRFPARTVNRFEAATTDPGRGRASYSWGFQSTIRYQSRHKLFDPSADDLLHALFVRDLLGRRLNQRLRYGERKAVYGASAGLVRRGPAAYLQVSSRIDRDDFDFATGIIDEEIAHLRNGSLDPAEFEADRAALVERLRASNQTAESLNLWTRNHFYDGFQDFPDVLGFYENVTQAQLAAFAEHRLRRHKTGPHRSPHPAPQPGDDGGGGRRPRLDHPARPGAPAHDPDRNAEHAVHRTVPPADPSSRRLHGGPDGRAAGAPRASA